MVCRQPFSVRGRYHLGRRHMVERHVFQVALRGAETARAALLHSGKRRDMLVIVPLVEFILDFGIDVHGIEQQGPCVRRRHLIARQRLLALEAQEALALGRDTLRPRRQVLPTDRLVGEAASTPTVSRSYVATDIGARRP